eukprot:Gregarina_sp_Poly_1__7169@NODE_392_length_8959_cov_63_078835_g321_i0_p3_GENE_NODE_392_length_8959_cov_63_078835_g321_i0NODE_392_length_8959_cov_63_078835_g321_i0_p3_ORF_typecomplete_len352_score56_75HPPK/PF01288_20/8_2e22Pterin_bind/PF00809_22/3e03Pterin_bind/PF00809_22/1_6e11zf_C2H2_13/PF18508_1/60zf_C2H2_13/PF18508_1/11_NODE_392_length_8959_cov_63_078835_g321_i032484303
MAEIRGDNFFGRMEHLNWTAYVALGSNLGDRVSYIETALSLLPTIKHPKLDLSISISNTSCLYETAPVDLQDHNDTSFLNCVVELKILYNWCSSCDDPKSCGAAWLLACCKHVEQCLGRPFHHPQKVSRVVDLDIIAIVEDVPNVINQKPSSLNFDIPYRDCAVCEINVSMHLVVPHRSTLDRRFVLDPMFDLNPNLIINGATVSSALGVLKNEPVKADGSNLEPHLCCVMGSNSLWHLTGERRDMKIVGVINVTPDSFSDGGELWDSNLDMPSSGEKSIDEKFSQQAQEFCEKQYLRICRMIDAGASGIDIGAESTRPGAVCISTNIQMRRLTGLMGRLTSLTNRAVFFY